MPRELLSAACIPEEGSESNDNDDDDDDNDDDDDDDGECVKKEDEDEEEEEEEEDDDDDGDDEFFFFVSVPLTDTVKLLPGLPNLTSVPRRHARQAYTTYPVAAPGSCLISLILYPKLRTGLTEQCPFGTSSQTTEHLLQSCPLYEPLRNGIWPDHSPVAGKLDGSLGGPPPLSRRLEFPSDQREEEE